MTGSLICLIPAFIITITMLANETSVGILPQLLFDSSDVLDLYFHHTRWPMSALSNIFSLPGMLGYGTAIWLPERPTATLGYFPETVEEIWHERQCLICTFVCSKGGRISDKGVWTSRKRVAVEQRGWRAEEPRTQSLFLRHLLRAQVTKWLWSRSSFIFFYIFTGQLPICGQ